MNSIAPCLIDHQGCHGNNRMFYYNLAPLYSVSPKQKNEVTQFPKVDIGQDKHNCRKDSIQKWHI